MHLQTLCSCGLTNVHVQAVLFVRDLDRGILGRGSHGLQQYEMLRRGTDALVNGILRVRRLLKQKRTADGDGEHLSDLMALGESQIRLSRCMHDIAEQFGAMVSQSLDSPLNALHGQGGPLLSGNPSKGGACTFHTLLRGRKQLSSLLCLCRYSSGRASAACHPQQCIHIVPVVRCDVPVHDVCSQAVCLTDLLLIAYPHRQR